MIAQHQKSTCHRAKQDKMDTYRQQITRNRKNSGNATSEAVDVYLEYTGLVASYVCDSNDHVTQKVDENNRSKENPHTTCAKSLYHKK